MRTRFGEIRRHAAAAVAIAALLAALATLLPGAAHAAEGRTVDLAVSAGLGAHTTSSSGNDFVYTVNVTNQGGSHSSEGTTLEFAYTRHWVNFTNPDHCKLMESTAATPEWSGGDGMYYACWLGWIAPGATVSWKIYAEDSADGVALNAIAKPYLPSFIGYDPANTDEVDWSDNEVVAEASDTDLKLGVFGGTSAVTSYGSQVGYNLTVQNKSTSTESTPVSVEFPYAPNLNLAAVPGGYQCLVKDNPSGQNQDWPGKYQVCYLGQLAPGSIKGLTIQFTALQAAPFKLKAVAKAYVPAGVTGAAGVEPKTDRDWADNQVEPTTTINVPTTLTVQQTSSPSYGQSVNYQVALKDAANSQSWLCQPRDIEFTIDGQIRKLASVAGVCGVYTTTVTGLSSGGHSVKARFGGSGQYQPSEQGAFTNVAKAPTSLVVTTSNPLRIGTSYYGVAVGSSTTGEKPTGTVTFSWAGGSNEPAKTATLVNGTAAVSAMHYFPGGRTLTVTYNGSGNFAGSTTTKSLYVSP